MPNLAVYINLWLPHKLSNTERLKTAHIYYVPFSVDHRSRHDLDGSSAQGLSFSVRDWPSGAFSSELHLRKGLLPSRCWQN